MAAPADANNDVEVPQHWTPQPVKAWRYWKVSDRFWNFGTHRWEVTLQGDIETWESPLKIAGYHGDKGHAAPQWGCLCGVNAVKQLDFDALRARTQDRPTPIPTNSVWSITWSMFEPPPFQLGKFPVAIGEVLLTGTVDEYELGYRAEQAQIENLTLIGGDSATRDILADVYGVPVKWEPKYGPTVQKLIDEKKEKSDGHGEADQKDYFGTGAASAASTGGVTFGAVENTREGRVLLRIKDWLIDHWPVIVVPLYGMAMYAAGWLGGAS